MESAPLFFADQFIEATFTLEGHHVYGAGQRRGPLMIDATAGWTRQPLWAADHANPVCKNQMLLILSESIKVFNPQWSCLAHEVFDKDLIQRAQQRKIGGHYNYCEAYKYLPDASTI